MLQRQVTISKLRRQSLCDRLETRGQNKLSHKTSRILPMRRTRSTWSPTKSKLCIEIKVGEDEEHTEEEVSCARSSTLCSNESQLGSLKCIEDLANHIRLTIPMNASEQREFWYALTLVGAVLCLLRLFQNGLNHSPAIWHIHPLLGFDAI